MIAHRLRGRSGGNALLLVLLGVIAAVQAIYPGTFFS